MSLTGLQVKTVELGKLAAEAGALEKRYTAHLSLFDAACMMGNETEQVQRREECHTLLDSILDNAASVHRLGTELRELMSLE